jgi:hypothetical protein
MKVRCKANRGKFLGTEVNRYFHSDDTQFGVIINTDYVVLGIGIWETVLLALIADDSGLPSWLPVALFDFEEVVWPQEWQFALLDPLAASGGNATNKWVARWGYSELVREPGHSDALIERNKEALSIFDRELRRH